MFKKSRLLMLSLAATPFAESVSAAGFHLNEQGTAGLGRAYAGEAAFGDNASGIARNPALATQLPGTQISTGVSYINPEIDAKGEATYLNGLTVNADQEDYVPSAWVPHAYLTQQLNDRWSWGLALNTHFGLKSELGSDYAAADLANEAEVMTYNINPSLAYRLTDDISVGVGLSLIKANATFATAAPMIGGAEILRLEGDDFGWGLNAGATWQVNDALRLGLGYRGEVELNFDGDASSDLDPSLNQGGSLKMDLPASAELSAVYDLNDRWTLSASVVWNDWSVFESLDANFADGTSQHLKDENFKDSYRYGLGVSYNINSQWTARAGVALDETAVPADYRSLSIPDTDRMWYSAGLTYQYDPKLSIDMGVALLYGDEVDQVETSALGTVFDGSTTGDGQIFGISVNYQF